MRLRVTKTQNYPHVDGEDRSDVGHWGRFLSSNLFAPEDADWILRRIGRVRRGPWQDYSAGCTTYILAFDRNEAWLHDFHNRNRQPGGQSPIVARIPLTTFENAIHAWVQVLKEAKTKPDGTIWDVEF